MDKYIEDLEYTSYLAERDYYNDISNILNNMILEDTVTLGFVTESVQEAVTKYITKVSMSTQKSWDKFKKKVDKKKDIAYLKKIRPSIIKFKSNDLFVNNYPEYNLQLIESLKVIPFEYDRMQQYLKSDTEFIKRFYPNVNFDNKISVSKAVKDSTLKNVNRRLQISKDFLIDKFNFNSKGYYDYIKLIENDLNMLNKSNNTIITMSKSIISNNESLDFRSVYESIYLEALPNHDNSKKQQSMTFTDSTGNKIDRRHKSSNSTYLRKIKSYITVSAGIVAGKMNVLYKEYKNNLSILDMVYKQSGGNIYTDKNGNPKTQITI